MVCDGQSLANSPRQRYCIQTEWIYIRHSIFSPKHMQVLLWVRDPNNFVCVLVHMYKAGLMLGLSHEALANPTTCFLAKVNLMLSLN